MFSNYEIRTNIASWDGKWVSAPNSHGFIGIGLGVNIIVLTALHHPPFRESSNKEKGPGWDQG